MRRLPVFLLLDVSFSMRGEAIEAVRNGLQQTISSLRQSPHALETAFVSVITFGDHARQVVPLTELHNFSPPTLNLEGDTAMGAALRLLARCLQTDVRQTTPTQKGDWRPLIFLMTDGKPSDEIGTALAELKRCKTGTIVACAAGEQADTELLHQITPNVISLETADSHSIGAFFRWISDSVQANSLSVLAGENSSFSLEELPPLPDELLNLDSLPAFEEEESEENSPLNDDEGTTLDFEQLPPAPEDDFYALND